jgi:hypothetical protein
MSQCEVHDSRKGTNDKARKKIADSGERVLVRRR